MGGVSPLHLVYHDVPSGDQQTFGLARARLDTPYVLQLEACKERDRDDHRKTAISESFRTRYPKNDNHKPISVFQLVIPLF